MRTSPVAQVVQGQVPGTQIFYSVEANTMRPGKVVQVSAGQDATSEAQAATRNSGRFSMQISTRSPAETPAINLDVAATDFFRRQIGHPRDANCTRI